MSSTVLLEQGDVDEATIQAIFNTPTNRDLHTSYPTTSPQKKHLMKRSIGSSSMGIRIATQYNSYEAGENLQRNECRQCR